jgi:hypothetical protein
LIRNSVPVLTLTTLANSIGSFEKKLSRPPPWQDPDNMTNPQRRTPMQVQKNGAPIFQDLIAQACSGGSKKRMLAPMGKGSESEQKPAEKFNYPDIKGPYFS